MRRSTQDAALEALGRRGISCSFSHLWSDALYARQQARNKQRHAEELSKQVAEFPDAMPQPIREKHLARLRAEMMQTRWDRGSYVRWAVIGAWMSFERVCGEAVNDARVSRDLRKNLPAALSRKGAVPTDWTEGLWKQVDGVRDRRNAFAHRQLQEGELFPEVEVAEVAVQVLRRAVIDLFERVQKPHPKWVECDSVPERLGGSTAWVNVSSAAADANPERLRLAAVFGDAEWDYELLEPDADPWPSIEALLAGASIPITSIRLYRGTVLAVELPVRIRGA